MYDRFDVEQDRPGPRVGEQEVQHVAEIDIRHVAERNEVADAEAAVRRPAQPGGHHRAGLADERDDIRVRLEVGDTGIDVDARNHNTEVVWDVPQHGPTTNRGRV